MRTLTAAVDRLEPIGLDRLDAVAPLLTRRDRKYVVPLTVAEELVSRHELRVLEIDGLRTFRYESVYFDTPDLTSYRDTAHKRRRRFKVRTRSYLDTGTCWLEVKTRERRGLTEKHRLPYPLQHRTELTDQGLDFIDTFDRIAPVSGDLRPALTIHYHRTTFLEPGSGSRITVDTDLRWQTPDGSEVSLPDMAVVETKTTGPPSSVDHLLWEAHRRPTKLSKYCTGLAALTPGLPANKWNRVLHTYFGWSPEHGAIASHHLHAPDANVAEWAQTPHGASHPRPELRGLPRDPQLVQSLRPATSQSRLLP